MKIEALFLRKSGNEYVVNLKEYSVVTYSDIPMLIHKTVNDVWRWARLNNFRVYVTSQFQ